MCRRPRGNWVTVVPRPTSLLILFLAEFFSCMYISGHPAVRAFVLAHSAGLRLSRSSLPLQLGVNSILNFVTDLFIFGHSFVTVYVDPGQSKPGSRSEGAAEEGDLRFVGGFRRLPKAFFRGPRRLLKALWGSSEANARLLEEGDLRSVGSAVHAFCQNGRGRRRLAAAVFDRIPETHKDLDPRPLTGPSTPGPPGPPTP